MFHLNSIRQAIIVNNEYGLNLQTAVILVPGVSWLVQKMKINHLVNELTEKIKVDKNFMEAGKIYHKIDRVYAWHCLGSFIQVVAFAILFKAVSRLFVAPLILEAFHCYNAITGFLGDRTKILVKENYVEVKR